MPTHPTDHTGKRFGRLTALALAGFVPYTNGAYVQRVYLWKCRCECGTEVTVRAANMVKGITRSCGCLQRERASKASTTHGRSLNRGRGVTRSDKLYSTWKGMLQRCRDPKADNWPLYGGRGIRVCDRWADSFDAFAADVGEPPSPTMSIDRFPDGNGNYEPGNVRWATPKEQRANTRKPVRAKTRTATTP